MSKRIFLSLALCLAHCTLRAAVPAAIPHDLLARGPLHSATNLAPDEAAAALRSPLPAVGADAAAALLARPGSAPHPPVVADGGVFECVVLPLGIHDAEGNAFARRRPPTGAAVGDPAELLLCTPDAVRAVVWRFRRGLGPEDVPVDLEHGFSGLSSDAPVLGRVLDLRFDERRGAVAILGLSAAGAEAAAAGRLRVSPELSVLVARNAAGDRLVIPWAVLSVALTADPALPTSIPHPLP